MPELGPMRLDRDLQKYIWNGKAHLHLKDLWEYLNRYTYLPRLKNQAVLVKAVQEAIRATVPGSFAYAERWGEKTERYLAPVIGTEAQTEGAATRDSVSGHRSDESRGGK